MVTENQALAIAAGLGVLWLGAKKKPGGGGIFGNLGGSALPLVTDEDDLGVTQLGDLPFSVVGSGDVVPVVVALPTRVPAITVTVATPVPVFPVRVATPARAAVPVTSATPVSVVPRSGPLTADEDIGVPPSPDVAAAPETGDIVVEDFTLTIDEDDFGITQLADLPAPQDDQEELAGFAESSSISGGPSEPGDFNDFASFEEDSIGVSVSSSSGGDDFDFDLDFTSGDFEFE